LHKNINLKLQKYGDPLTLTIKEKQTIKDKQVEKERTFILLTYKRYTEFNKTQKYKKNDKKVQTVPEKDVFRPMSTINWRTRRNLTNVCAVCGTDKNVEKHHVKHIRKGKVVGFSQVLKQMNRTMIPLCTTHHKEVHSRKYNDIKLIDLFGLE
jgi:hypothetical protein